MDTKQKENKPANIITVNSKVDAATYDKLLVISQAECKPISGVIRDILSKFFEKGEQE